LTIEKEINNEETPSQITEFDISSIDNEQVDAKKKKAKTGKSSKLYSYYFSGCISDQIHVIFNYASSCSLILRTVLGSSLHVGQTQNPIVSFVDAKKKKAKTGKSSKFLKKTNNEFNSDVQCICKGTGKSSLIQCSWCQFHQYFHLRDRRAH
jgi:hypothetical protein